MYHYFKLNAYYLMLFDSVVTVRVGFRFSVWLVSGYAHVFNSSLSLCCGLGAPVDA